MSLMETDNILRNIRGKIDYQKYLTPVNFVDENAKFIEEYNNGRKYNPQYEYVPFKEADIQLNNIENSENKGLSSLFNDAIDEINLEAEMYGAIGDAEKFTRLAKKIYGTPSPELIDTALETIHSDSGLAEANQQFVAPAELKSAIEERLAVYGYKWEIEILDNMAAKVSVEPENRTVYINGNKKFTASDRRRLLVHEIDTHVLRAENGFARNYFILAYGTSKSLMHEEGLAIYNEYSHNVLDKDTLKLYAGRFLACANIHLSFYEMFDMLVREGLSTEQSMYIVSRIKRGLTDTSQAGGFIKDYVYFQGFLDVKTAVEADPALYRKMYYGSISLEDCDLLSDDIHNAMERNEIIYPKEVN